MSLRVFLTDGGTLVVAAIANVLAAGGSMLAQVADSGSVDQVTPWLNSGATVASVSALVYIARLFANGSLVARQPAESEKKLQEIVEKLSDLLAEAHQREKGFIDLLTRKD